jgi:predicted DNA-binding transcriptional regulator YafY
MAGSRADDVQYAERVNAAADLIAGDVSAMDAATALAARFGVSTRQARRYVDQASSTGRRLVPEGSVVFTVKLPASLAVRVREQAARSEVAISALVAQALTEFLASGSRRDPRR